MDTLLSIKCSEKNSSSHNAGERRVTDKMCQRTGRLTLHVNTFFFHKWNQLELLLNKA